MRPSVSRLPAPPATPMHTAMRLGVEVARKVRALVPHLPAMAVILIRNVTTGFVIGAIGTFAGLIIGFLVLCLVLIWWILRTGWKLKS